MRVIEARDFLDLSFIHAASKKHKDNAIKLAKAAKIEHLLADRFQSEYLIDVRSPREFKQAHLKQALNYFALNDAEHQQVGSLYAKDQWSAKALGAALICKNANHHIKHISKSAVPYASRVLITCAKGGQRSGSVGHILSEIGFEVLRASGGMKAVRTEAINRLQNFKDDRFVCLAGLTASGKTRLLKQLDDALDLEGLANHLGSTFGSRGSKQPSQQQFDYALLFRMFELSCASKIFVEAESKNIGQITLSNAFYEALNSGLIINCSASLDVRVANCVEDYKNISSEFFYACLLRLKKYLGASMCAELSQHYEAKRLNDVARILLLNYYDKVYKRPKRIDCEINCDDITQAAGQIKIIASQLNVAN